MASGAGNKIINRLVLSLATVLLGIALFCVTSLGNGVFAQSAIKATICDPDGPEIHVSEPVSDSVVNMPYITIKGTTQRTSQIDVFVNNEYAHSTALALNNPFNIEVSLGRGTNTIRLDAYYSCNQTKRSITLVLTYDPDVAPGSSTTKVTPPGDYQPDVISNPSNPPKFFSRDGLTDKIKTSFWPDASRSIVIPLFNWLLLLIMCVLLIVFIWPERFRRQFYSLPDRIKRKILRMSNLQIRIVCIILLALTITLVMI